MKVIKVTSPIVKKKLSFIITEKIYQPRSDTKDISMTYSKIRNLSSKIKISQLK